VRSLIAAVISFLIAFFSLLGAVSTETTLLCSLYVSIVALLVGSLFEMILLTIKIYVSNRKSVTATATPLHPAPEKASQTAWLQLDLIGAGKVARRSQTASSKR
jgi:hypothetical protein